MDKRLFHYTVGTKINHIISDGYIDLETDGGVNFKSQRPAVWCTFSPKWEETCNKGLVKNGRHKFLNREETARHADGLYRIEVNTESASHDWQSWKQKSRASSKIIEALRKSAEEKGSDISFWRASFEPISMEDCITIEKFDDKRDEWLEDPISMWAVEQNTQ